MDKLAESEYIVFSSGGTQGLMYAGVLDAIEDHIQNEGITYMSWRDRLRGVAGCSAGAISALTLVLGLDKHQRSALFLETDVLKDIRNLVREPDIAQLITRFGIDKGKGIRELVKTLLEMGGLSAASTLGDIQRLLKINFVCVASCLRTSTAKYLSGELTPSIRVCDAVYASCAIPFLFTPYAFGDDEVLVDGCLTEHIPRVFDSEQKLFAICCASYRSSLSLPKSLQDYTISILRCVEHMRHTSRSDRSMALYSDTNAFDFCLTRESMNAIIDDGYVLSVNYFAEDRIRLCVVDITVIVCTLLLSLKNTLRDIADDTLAVQVCEREGQT